MILTLLLECNCCLWAKCSLSPGAPNLNLASPQLCRINKCQQKLRPVFLSDVLNVREGHSKAFPDPDRNKTVVLPGVTVGSQTLPQWRLCMPRQAKQNAPPCKNTDPLAQLKGRRLSISPSPSSQEDRGEKAVEGGDKVLMFPLSKPHPHFSFSLHF